MNSIKSFVCIVALAVGVIPFQAVEASGSGGFGNRSAPTQQRKPVDAAYERGKALFAGREKSYGKIRVCVTNEKADKPTKVKKKLLKPYKNGTAISLVDNLYSCEATDQKISQIYERNDLAALVHYFDKRYKLKLKY